MTRALVETGALGAWVVAAGALTVALGAAAADVAPQVLVALAGLVGGLLVGVRRVPAERLMAPCLGLAIATSALLWTPLGAPRLGALRDLSLGGFFLQPAPLWVLACVVCAVAMARGKPRAARYSAVALAGASVAAITMPELSIVPQVGAALVAIAWLSGHRALAIGFVLLAVLAVALSPLFPYVQRRWVGWLDAAGHAGDAGWEYNNLARMVTSSEWLGGAEGARPRLSSPHNDYWVATAMWRFGRLPVLAWALGLVAGALALARGRARAPQSPRRSAHLLAWAAVAVLVVTLVIHGAYNVGLLPITAVEPPLAGTSGTAMAVPLFVLGYALGARAPQSIEEH